MDFLGALKSEIFRPLASVVLPGVLALSPCVILTANAIPEVQNFYKDQSTWFFWTVIALATVVGMLLEDIGSSIERGIDRCMDLEYLYGHDKVWIAYLSKGVVDNNGRRFLGAIVTRLKFINSIIPAVLFFSIGIFLLDRQVDFMSPTALLVFLVGMATLICWLFRTSTELSEVASSTRYCLLEEADRPAEYDMGAIPVRRIRHFAYAVGEILTSRVFDIDLRGRVFFCVIPESVAIFTGWKRTKAAILARHSGEGIEGG